MLELVQIMDRATADWFASIRDPVFTLFFRIITQLGSVAVIIFLSFGIMAFLTYRHRWSELKAFFFTVGGGELLNESLKWLIQRERPLLPWLTSATGFSFPSGHTLLSTVFYIFIARLIFRSFPDLPKRSLISGFLIAIPAFVGISRIYLGVHFLTDVIGGWIIGMLWLTYAIRIWQYLDRF